MRCFYKGDVFHFWKEILSNLSNELIMTMPPEFISVKCPKCGEVFEDFIRRSINFGLDNFSDEYIEQCKFATCPKCGIKIPKNVLIVDKEGVFNFH